MELALSYFEKYCIKYGQDSIGGASIPPLPEKADLQQHTSIHCKQTVVLDVGIADEANLSLIKGKGYDYVYLGTDSMLILSTVRIGRW